MALRIYKGLYAPIYAPIFLRIHCLHHQVVADDGSAGHDAALHAASADAHDCTNDAPDDAMETIAANKANPRPPSIPTGTPVGFAMDASIPGCKSDSRRSSREHYSYFHKAILHIVRNLHCVASIYLRCVLSATGVYSLCLKSSACS